MLLDEITTDLDLLARQDLLEWLKEEAEQRGACVVYCTHIFDGLDGWASHVTYILRGELRFSSAVDAIKDLLSVPPEERTNGWGELFCAVQRWLREQRPDMLQMLGETTAAPARAPLDLSSLPPAVVVSHLTWSYKAGGATVLPDLSFTIPRGCRCLLTGANGAGKTTLLRLLGGKHMIPDGMVTVLGRPVFRDLALNTLVAILSGDWTRSVACVGNGVPFQADFSLGEMTERYREALVKDGMDEGLLLPRLARLKQLLDIDMEWRLNRVSDGQRRRCQLLLKLLRPSELLLMDEVTTDLDLIARQALLVFLREESEVRGVTVIYSTHIFDGVDDWPTHMLHLKKGGVHFNGPIADAPAAAPTAADGATSTSGSLFKRVRGWLEQERTERRQAKAEAASLEVEATPMEVDRDVSAVGQASPPPAAPATAPHGPSSRPTLPPAASHTGSRSAAPLTLRAPPVRAEGGGFPGAAEARDCLQRARRGLALRRRRRRQQVCPLRRRQQSRHVPLMRRVVPP